MRPDCGVATSPLLDQDSCLFQRAEDFAVGQFVASLAVGALLVPVFLSLPLLIISGYALEVMLTAIAPPEIIGIAYDPGGVTTSTVTVPLVIALGVGLASSLRGRDPMLDGLGLIAFTALFPIITVLAYGQLAILRERISRSQASDNNSE